MKTSELLLIVANLLVEIADNDTKLAEIQTQIDKTEPPEGAAIYEERSKLVQVALSLQAQQDAFHEKCAADPYISMFMYCWMLEVSGKPDMDVPPDLDDAAADKIIEDMEEHGKEFAEKVGGLMPQVRQLITDLGYRPARTMVSAHHWAYNIACDDKEATALTCCLRAKFHRAFESGSLTLRKKFGDWNFKMIPNVTAARDFLEQLAEHKAEGKSIDTFLDDDEDEDGD